MSADLERMSLSAYALLYGLEPQPAALGAYMGGVFGFLDPEHLLAHRLPAKGTSAAFETVDLHGQVLDTWTVPKHWTIVDISPDKRRLAVVPDEHFSKTLVVDYPSMNVVLKKGNPYGGGSGSSWQFLTEAGRTLCSVEVLPSDPTRTPSTRNAGTWISARR
jgi:hypothetical protein